MFLPQHSYNVFSPPPPPKFCVCLIILNNVFFSIFSISCIFASPSLAKWSVVYSPEVVYLYLYCYILFICIASLDFQLDKDFSNRKFEQQMSVMRGQVSWHSRLDCTPVSILHTCIIFKFALFLSRSLECGCFPMNFVFSILYFHVALGNGKSADGIWVLPKLQQLLKRHELYRNRYNYYFS